MTSTTQLQEHQGLLEKLNNAIDLAAVSFNLFSNL